MNTAQGRAFAARIAHSSFAGQISYSYDAQGHLTEIRKSGHLSDNEVTTVSYNKHGDKAEERTTTVTDPDMMYFQEDGTIVPDREPQPVPPPTQHETRYTYQYDSNGNWTEQTMVVRYSADPPWEPTCRRNLT